MVGEYEILPQAGGMRYTPHEITARHWRNEQLKFKLENINSKLRQASYVFHHTQQGLQAHSGETWSASLSTGGAQFTFRGHQGVNTQTHPWQKNKHFQMRYAVLQFEEINASGLPYPTLDVYQTHHSLHRLTHLPAPRPATCSRGSHPPPPDRARSPLLGVLFLVWGWFFLVHHSFSPTPCRIRSHGRSP